MLVLSLLLKRRFGADCHARNALFLAMDNFFRQIVNFSEQSFVEKVAVPYFATIAERQIALP